MNSSEITEKIQAEINTICETNRNKYRRQYPITKWAREELQALGLWEYIPASAGQMDAQDILKATTTTSGASGDEAWSYIGTIGSLLEKLATAQQSEQKPADEHVTVTTEADFEIGDVKFRVYRDILWSDGGEYDDLVIRELPESRDITDYNTEFEITITPAELAEARDHQEYLNEAENA